MTQFFAGCAHSGAHYCVVHSCALVCSLLCKMIFYGALWRTNKLYYILCTIICTLVCTLVR
jgi:hypothetical protein